MEHVLIPVNCNGNHWMIVDVRPMENSIMIMDSYDRKILSTGSKLSKINFNKYTQFLTQRTC